MTDNKTQTSWTWSIAPFPILTTGFQHCGSTREGWNGVPHRLGTLVPIKVVQLLFGEFRLACLAVKHMLLRNERKGAHRVSCTYVDQTRGQVAAISHSPGP